MDKAKFKKLAKKYDLDLLILFGSCSQKEDNHLSDLDIAFYRQKYMPEDEEEQLWEELLFMVRKDKVDFINLKTHHSALLRYEIFVKGTPLFEKKAGLFAKMRWEAYLDFEDFKRFFKQKGLLLKENIYSL